MLDLANVKRTLRLIAGSFAAGSVALVAVLSLLDLGEAESPDLADSAAVLAGVIGVVGLLLAVVWWARISERPRSPAALQMGFLVRAAIAEVGLLIGVLGFFMTGSLTAPLIGLGLFLAALLFLVLAVNLAAAN
jgi:hypothetical protein